MTSGLAGNPLPPVSPGKLNGSRPMGAPQVVHKTDSPHKSDHPFDVPFSIIKTLQAAFARLEEDLRQERQQRGAEVAGLQTELAGLKEQVRKGEEKQHGDHHNLVQTIKELEVKEEHDWSTTRRELEAELAKRCSVVQHDALNDRVDATSKWLKETNELLNRKAESMERRIQENTDGDGEFAQSMQNELTAQRKQLDINTVNDEEFACNVLSRMQAAAQLLRSAGHSRAPPPPAATLDPTLAANPGAAVAASPSSRKTAPDLLAAPDTLGTTARRALGSMRMRSKEEAAMLMTTVAPPPTFVSEHWDGKATVACRR